MPGPKAAVGCAIVSHNRSFAWPEAERELWTSDPELSSKADLRCLERGGRLSLIMPQDLAATIRRGVAAQTLRERYARAASDQSTRRNSASMRISTSSEIRGTPRLRPQWLRSITVLAEKPEIHLP